ncbi:RDD family protein [Corynebacterium kutscheri]|uniref:Hypothetical membrane protein n=1 Tax=Corynebacterium kutscheri TaxID=35755 RepID=A0AB38VXH4_9CORY|nr:RDD family protein [Corynebacterium kutscheri]VEH08893.1 hypothetical membrane protein [Corynebacterium kutscheri]
MNNPKRSWLDGPQIPGEYDGIQESRWPGELLGLPEFGSGALASVRRRAGGVAIDWAICVIVASFINIFTHQLGGTSTLAMLLFILLGTLSVTFFARTPGQMLLGMGVGRIDIRDAHVGFVRACARSLLTCFVLPAAMVDSDGRGMHDRATGTAVILS